MAEHDHEPVRGLPQRLPAGETILWQGAPSAGSLARYGFHLGALALYFAALLAWCAVRLWMQGASGIGRELALLTGLALVALGLIALFAWLVARTSIYTITDRRVVLRVGIAFPFTLNVPFAAIEQAGMRRARDGSGDLPLTLSASTGMGWLILWPHVRPWRVARAQPMLRSVPDVEQVARLLGRALAAAAAQVPQAAAPLAEPGRAGASLGTGDLAATTAAA